MYEQVELIHQPCPYEKCGSSDAFSWNTKHQIGQCHSCDTPYPSRGNKVFDWASKTYPLKKDRAVIKLVEPAQRVDDEQGVWMHNGHRKVTARTMEFYGVKTYVEDEVPLKHTYTYPDGSTKTRVFPKEFFTGKGFKSDKLFGMDKFPAGSAQAVTITEGELDAMSGYQMMGQKYPFVSLPSATPNKRLLENCKDWLGWSSPVCRIRCGLRGWRHHLGLVHINHPISD